MILLDTNVVIDARDSSQAYHDWAVRQIENAVAGEGGGINVVALTELCVGAAVTTIVETEIRKFGLAIFDLPVAVAAVCGKAYRRYIAARRQVAGGNAPKIPLPDFFIGAHAECLGWKLATRDDERIRRYFPNVKLITP